MDAWVRMPISTRVFLLFAPFLGGFGGLTEFPQAQDPAPVCLTVLVRLYGVLGLYEDVCIGSGGRCILRGTRALDSETCQRGR